MSRIRSKGNRTTELRFVRPASPLPTGIHGWRRGCKLFGKPDFIFREAKVVVFVDGDFWHGNPKRKDCQKATAITGKGKLARTECRDRLVNRDTPQGGMDRSALLESDLREEGSYRREDRPSRLAPMELSSWVIWRSMMRKLQTKFRVVVSMELEVQKNSDSESDTNCDSVSAG
jgi:G:T-mismatch repair DNA endonuclease (very short patch repair protein)